MGRGRDKDGAKMPISRAGRNTDGGDRPNRAPSVHKQVNKILQPVPLHPTLETYTERVIIALDCSLVRIEGTREPVPLHSTLVTPGITWYSFRVRTYEIHGRSLVEIEDGRETGRCHCGRKGNAPDSYRRRREASSRTRYVSHAPQSEPAVTTRVALARLCIPQTTDIVPGAWYTFAAVTYKEK